MYDAESTQGDAVNNAQKFIMHYYSNCALLLYSASTYILNTVYNIMIIIYFTCKPGLFCDEHLWHIQYHPILVFVPRIVSYIYVYTYTQYKKII